MRDAGWCHSGETTGLLFSAHWLISHAGPSSSRRLHAPDNSGADFDVELRRDRRSLF
jgi:hypothetical protein